MVRVLELSDYQDWLVLAAQVEHLFGAMTNSDDFRAAIKECIKNNDAYGIENVDNTLVGIIALNREDNEISWLVVDEKYRGKSFGKQLITKAIEELSSNGDIYVQTFAKDIEEGKAVRYLYEKQGFTDFSEAGLNPAGFQTVFMVRKG
jgi:GNAT superfamily N-acetyltransferase